MAGWLDRINVDVGTRYFFFSSLTSYGDEGKAIYEKAASILSTPQSQGQNVDAEGAIQDALGFLKSAADKEKQMEILCFQNKILGHPFFKKPENKKYLEQIEKIFTPDNFDYNKFLAAINFIAQDSDDINKWYEQLTQVKAEYKQFNDYINTLTQKDKNSQKKFEYNPSAIIADIFSKTDTIDSKQVVSSMALINIIILGIAPTLFNTEVRPGFISKI